MPRLPRFKRISNPPGMRLTQRDIEILRHISTHRFLRSTHIIQLLDGSAQSLLRRLRLLFQNGYLDRPRIQLEYYRSGSDPMVYSLGNKAVEILEAEIGIPRRQVDWTAKNRIATRLFLEHTLSVADVLVAIEIAVRAACPSRISFLPGRVPAEPWKVTINVDQSRTALGILPDAVFALRLGNQPETVWIFLEADRGTMPVKRRGLKQTSFFRKILAYYELWRQRAVYDQFPRFRVLTVTTTSERASNMIDASQSLPHGHGLFLFVDKESFLKAENPLRAPLRNGRGETTCLIE